MGKSTLAVLCAARIAEREDVVLIDADLTGTSLSDVLPLLAPAWKSGAVSLTTKPDLDPVDPNAGVEARVRNEAAEPNGVPYLNDWLRYPRDAEWKDPEYDVAGLLWKPMDARIPERLRVIPSSALPADLWAVLPLLYDETFSAFAESRLEWLLDGLLALGFRAFVFDTPPTLPGFSRAVLSMALRLPDGQPLAQSGAAPSRVEGAQWAWMPWLVSTQDKQDLLATERWLGAILPEERSRIGVVLNRFSGSPDSVQSVVTELLVGRPAEEAALVGRLPDLLTPPPVVLPAGDAIRLFDAFAEFRLPNPLPTEVEWLVGDMDSATTAEV